MQEKQFRMSEFYSDNELAVDISQRCTKKSDAGGCQNGGKKSSARISSGQELTFDDIMAEALPRSQKVRIPPEISRRGKQWRNTHPKTHDKKVNLNYLVKIICETKETCLDWMKEMGFIPKIMFCPHCKASMFLEINEDEKDGCVWICRKKECEGNPPRYSPRHGQWFEKTNLSLVEVLLLVYFWTHNFSAVQIRNELNMTEESYEEWDSLLSNICRIFYKNELGRVIEESEDNEAHNTDSASLFVSMWKKDNKSKDTFIEFLKQSSSV